MAAVSIAESYQLRDERLRDIPDRFQRGVTAVSTASELDARQWTSGFSVVQTPCWRFAALGMVVLASKPVSIRTSKGESLFFAENENLGIYAAGESRNEAIQVFSEQVVHFYQHYKGLSWDRVTGEAHRLKYLYENLFRNITASKSHEPISQKTCPRRAFGKTSPGTTSISIMNTKARRPKLTRTYPIPPSKRTYRETFS